jgi:hypothetical protein
MKINIESYTNPITEDILQKKDFQYPSGSINVKIPDEIKNYIIQILRNTDDIKDKQDTVRDILLSHLNNIAQLLGQVNMYLESINNFFRNQH